MSDILSVSLQDFLYSRKSELRKGEISAQNRIVNVSSDVSRCLFLVKTEGLIK